MEAYERWVDGVLYGGPHGQNAWLLEYPEGRPGETYQVLPGVFQIKSQAFARSRYLREVTIPESVKDCGYLVFAGCRALERVICHGNHLGKYAFNSCPNLRSLELYGDAIYLDRNAIDDCPNLHHIVVHPGAVLMSKAAFSPASRKLCYVCTGEMAEEIGAQNLYIEYDTWRAMNESMEQFAARTAFVHARMDTTRRFETSLALCDKADESGALLPYIGDTVIFDLNEGTKAWLADAQKMIYDACARYTLFAQPIDPASFHITLHDLCSGTMEKAEEIARGMQAREEAVCAHIEAFRWQYDKTIRLRVKGMMNMLGTSVVLVFEPVCRDDWEPLNDMYMRLQRVEPLSYMLTPHVTLAYYRPDAHGYGADVTQALQQVMDEANGIFVGREIELPLSSLRYSCFTDMNHYCTREAWLGALQEK
ncbi:MAG: leucine-rich repeat protein [Clostridia bacterium]|nr:leucine-rich repeat protein [Clostridia bacterium]